MADLLFVGQFIASKAGKTGLTVTVDVDRYALADGSRTALVTAGSATEGRRGLYHYRLASADLATYQYVTTFITADATVDQQEIAALGLVLPDALVSSRLAPATAGRTLTVDANGVAEADVMAMKNAALIETVAGRLAASVSTFGDVAVPVATAANRNQTGDAYARLGSPAGASVSADIANVPTVTEFEARTLVAADYVVVTDLPSVPSAATVADAVWDEAIAGHAGAGTTGEALAGATAPSASTVADAVWDELLAGHVGVGSAGAGLAAAGSAGDPWSTPLPGAYGEGTAGKLLSDVPTLALQATALSIQAKTDLITAGGSVTVVAPVASDGDVTVYQGDDYASVDSRALDWSGTTWPDLTSASILLMVRAQTGVAFSKAGTVVSAGGATQTVRVELTDDETALLAAWPAESELRIRATLSSGGKATIVDSTLSVIEDVA